MRLLFTILLMLTMAKAKAQESFCGRITVLGAPDEKGMRDLVLHTGREVKTVCPVVSSSVINHLDPQAEEAAWNFYFEHKLQVCFYPEEFSEDLHRNQGCYHAVNQLTTF